MNDLPIYGVDIDDIPTCPKCGARTDFEQLDDNPDIQNHTCLNCGYQFIAEIDND